MNPFGVMQGRLLPKYQGRYQAHPVGYWQEEFVRAFELGLDCIEFIFDFNEVEKSPLLSSDGQKQIAQLVSSTKVAVYSICADYFMQFPLHSAADKVLYTRAQLLKLLISVAATLHVRDIVIPCVDQSSIQSLDARIQFIELLSDIAPFAEQNEINLALETDLDPSSFGTLLDQLPFSAVTVNYDIGNSAALGYSAHNELSVYGEKITNIHIKDRALHGGSVALGSGNADIPGFFKLLEAYDYCGLFIMQAYRDDEGITIFKSQLDWLKPYLPIQCQPAV